MNNYFNIRTLVPVPTLLALATVSACNSNSDLDFNFPETAIDPIDQSSLSRSLW